jgi:hypothetical protein
VDEVRKNIEKRIKICGEDTIEKDYALIIPFGIYPGKDKNGEINVKCIIEPILTLKAKGFQVVPISLRKERAKVVRLIDELMSKVAKYQIDSDKTYERQAPELWKIVRSELAKKENE